MCGRYTLFTDRELKEIDDIINQLANDSNRGRMKTGEIFPTDTVPVLTPENQQGCPPSFHLGLPFLPRQERHNKRPLGNGA